jgi:hypothetical protein
MPEDAVRGEKFQLETQGYRGIEGIAGDPAETHRVVERVEIIGRVAGDVDVELIEDIRLTPHGTLSYGQAATPSLSAAVLIGMRALA